MRKETVMVLSRFNLICSGHRETPENLRIAFIPPGDSKGVLPECEPVTFRYDNEDNAM
jgi:hypothetical protein